jgi:hypothetical protein
MRITSETGRGFSPRPALRHAFLRPPRFIRGEPGQSGQVEKQVASAQFQLACMQDRPPIQSAGGRPGRAAAAARTQNGQGEIRTPDTTKAVYSISNAAPSTARTPVLEGSGSVAERGIANPQRHLGRKTRSQTHIGPRHLSQVACVPYRRASVCRFARSELVSGDHIRIIRIRCPFLNRRNSRRGAVE